MIRLVIYGLLIYLAGMPLGWLWSVFHTRRGYSPRDRLTDSLMSAFFWPVRLVCDLWEFGEEGMQGLIEEIAPAHVPEKDKEG